MTKDEITRKVKNKIAQRLSHNPVNFPLDLSAMFFKKTIQQQPSFHATLHCKNLVRMVLGVVLEPPERRGRGGTFEFPPGRSLYGGSASRPSLCFPLSSSDRSLSCTSCHAVRSNFPPALFIASCGLLVAVAISGCLPFAFAEGKQTFNNEVIQVNL